MLFSLAAELCSRMPFWQPAALGRILNAPQDPVTDFTEEVAVGYVLVPVVVAIESFEQRADAPASVVILQDLSGSMEIGGNIELSPTQKLAPTLRAGPSAPSLPCRRGRQRSQGKKAAWPFRWTPASGGRSSYLLGPPSSAGRRRLCRGTSAAFSAAQGSTEVLERRSELLQSHSEGLERGSQVVESHSEVLESHSALPERHSQGLSEAPRSLRVTPSYLRVILKDSSVAPGSWESF